MFEGLRKKIADTIKGFSKREETKVETEELAAEKQETKPAKEIEKAPIPEARIPEAHRTESRPETKAEAREVRASDNREEPRKAEIHHAKTEAPAPAKLEEPHMIEHQKTKSELHAPERHGEAHRIEERKTKADAPAPESHEKREEVHKAPVEKPAERQDTGPKIDLKLTTKIKKIFIKKITLSSTELDGFAESLKEPMLRSDVSYSTTEEFIRDLKTQLTGLEISSGRIDEEVTMAVRAALMQILEGNSPKVGLNAMITRRIEEGGAPVKILFLGPNGAGKTTTIAKIAYTMKAQGVSAVISASDTFRAAAIEQLEIHAKKIGVPVVKSKYGADPASVAFDAIAHARANGTQLVLIDSAGRQETNKSLINEMEKIARVCKPDITIFIGESTAGNVISEQISEFGKYIHIDGIILTKLDCDAKGGSALSIAKVTGIPILFFGIGEGYDALIPYSSEFVVNAILPQGG
jgi:fused signal recognition particle receptor